MTDGVDPFESRLRAGLEGMQPSVERTAVERRLGDVVQRGGRRRRRRRAGGAAAVVAVLALVLSSALAGAERAEPDQLRLGGTAPRTSTITSSVPTTVAESSTTTTVLPVDPANRPVTSQASSSTRPPTTFKTPVNAAVPPPLLESTTTTTALPPPLPCLEVDYRGGQDVGFVHPGPRDAYGRIRSVCLRITKGAQVRLSSLPLTEGTATVWVPHVDGGLVQVMAITGPPRDDVSWPYVSTSQTDWVVRADVDDITREGIPTSLLVE